MAQEIGRNDPCPCGSGKKYKKCCLRKRKEAEGAAKSLTPTRQDAVASLAQGRANPDDGERGALTMQTMQEAEHFIDWDAFWDDFEAVSLDKKLEMTRERIDNAPDFDEEWVFSLMIDGLMMPCKRERRGSAWIEMLEYLRQKRAEFVEPEAGVLGLHAVNFALTDDLDYLDSALELLFSNPGQSVDHIFRALERLAFFGDTRVHDRLKAQWSVIRAASGLIPEAFLDWADWALCAQMAVWADDDPEQTRTLNDLEEALGDLVAHLDAELAEQYPARFLGPDIANFDAATLAEIKDARKQEVALSFAFAHSLVVDTGWPSFKAVLAGVYVGGLLQQQADCDDPFQHPLSTKVPDRSREIRRELKEFRDLWRQDSRFAPHPDLALGYVEMLSQRGFFGTPYTAATFLEAIVRLAPWLAERGILENPALVEATQRHFARRFSAASEDLRFMTSEHPGLIRSLAQTRGWLGVLSQ